MKGQPAVFFKCNRSLRQQWSEKCRI